jgi:hypothetical protein
MELYVLIKITLKRFFLIMNQNLLVISVHQPGLLL